MSERMTAKRKAALAETYGPDRAYVSPKVERRRSPIGGWGLFATEPIAAGEVVGRDAGRVLTRDEFLALPQERQNHCYYLDDNFLLAPFDFDHPSDEWFMNHSCDANTGVTPDRSNVALRDIAAGEELTYDYATTECDEDWRLEVECRCGAADCRGTVTGSDWRIPAIQERYAGHFSPHLAARIAALRSGPRKSR
ncbi:MAG: SET domain-containing protein [Actinomycetota bacterium]